MALPPADKVATLTPAQQRQQQSAARAMLAEERGLLKGIRDDVSEVADDTIAEIARRDDRTSDAAKAAMLMLLLTAADRLRSRTRTRIAAARMGARRASSLRFNHELVAAAGYVGLGIASHLEGHHPYASEDRPLADASADAFAAAWKAGLVYAVTQALRRDENPARAVDLAAERLDARARRIAATEVPQAYNDAHRRAGESAAETLKDVGTDVALIVRRWDAILDVRTCPECRSHDGEVTPLGQAFKSGDEPGFMHNWCRCMSTIVAIPRVKP